MISSPLAVSSPWGISFLGILASICQPQPVPRHPLGGTSGSDEPTGGRVVSSREDGGSREQGQHVAGIPRILLERVLFA